MVGVLWGEKRAAYRHRTQSGQVVYGERKVAYGAAWRAAQEWGGVDPAYLGCLSGRRQKAGSGAVP